MAAKEEPPNWAMKKAQEIVSGFIDAQINAVVGEIEKANPVDLSSIEEFYASLVAESDRGEEAAARLACVSYNECQGA